MGLGKSYPGLVTPQSIKFLVLQKRSLIFSLPMVFLAYAIIGFITAIVLYYLRGAKLTNTPTIQGHLGHHTHWMTVSAVGALAGVLTMSALLFRR